VTKPNPENKNCSSVLIRQLPRLVTVA